MTVVQVAASFALAVSAPVPRAHPDLLAAAAWRFVQSIDYVRSRGAPPSPLPPFVMIMVGVGRPRARRRGH